MTDLDDDQLRAAVAWGLVPATDMISDDILNDSPPADLFVADPHRWGEGKIHLVRDYNRTYCGLEGAPGEYRPGHMDELNCLRCIRSEDAERKAREREREYYERSQQWQQEKQRKDKEWREWYDAYLQSPEWRERRRLVLLRDNNLCQGCLTRRATQVHHLTYERVGKEMLWNLASICDECHEEVHGR